MALSDRSPGEPNVATFYDHLMSSGFFVFDEEQPYFQEKLLQVIWNEQLLEADLRTADGEPLQVIHPGVWNVEAGPDFHDAAIFLRGETRRGAVEIHHRPELWTHHGHHRQADYAAVILHVVWENPRELPEFPPGVPLLVLRGRLKPSLPTIIEQVDLAGYPYARQVPPGPCADALAGCSTPFLRELLQSYGVARAIARAVELSRRIAAVGLEAAVTARLFDILGYKNNREPFARLAAAVSAQVLEGMDRDTMLAVMLGAAGLLPDPSQCDVLPRHRAWLAQLWQAWWPRRLEHQPIVWNRHRLRPFNCPERRVVAGALLLHAAGGRLGQRLIEGFRQAASPADAVDRLRGCFALGGDEAWHRFYSFERDLERPAQLLGQHRVNDLLVNLAVPLYLASCMLAGRPDDSHLAKHVLRRLPRLQDNRLFKEAVQRYLIPPGRAAEVVTNACAQQGLLHLHRQHLPA